MAKKPGKREVLDKACYFTGLVGALCLLVAMLVWLGSRGVGEFGKLLTRSKLTSAAVVLAVIGTAMLSLALLAWNFLDPDE